MNQWLSLSWEKIEQATLASTFLHFLISECEQCANYVLLP